MFFANADSFVSRALEAVEENDRPVEWFLLNSEANTDFDLTAVDAAEELRARLEERGIRFAMARVKQASLRQLSPAGFVDRVGEENIFPTLPAAVREYARRYREVYGELPEGVPASILES